jgi:TolB-like protein
MERRLAAILTADVVGYSRLIRADEEGTIAALRALRANLIDPKIAAHRGRIVKLMGDGMLAEFASVVDAVHAAIEAQRSIIEHNAGLPEKKRIEFRVGINLGDVVIDGDDIQGDGINVAARLEGMAEPGGICVSGMVYEGVRDRIDALFEDMGEHEVKNIDRPVRMWRWVAGAAPSTATSLAFSTPLALPDKPSIAVLPFDNMSGDVEQEYFADGISEDIITSLSKLSGLLVIARNSSFAYKGKAINLQKVASELGVRYVLEGSVRKSGERVRISAQLIDRETGGHLWAERFDRDLTDIFAVQDEVTQEIVSAMAVKLTGDEKIRLPQSATDNLDAYDYFLRGREQFWLFSKEGIAQAGIMLRQAIKLDPNFAPSYTFLSHARIQDYVNHWHAENDHPLDEAFELASTAVELDENYPKAHSSLGNAYLWQRRHDSAIDEYQKSLALDPNFALAYMETGRAYHYAGRSSEAVDFIKRAMRLDPHYPDIYLHSLAQAHFHLGQYEEAVELLKRRLIRKPDTDISRVLLAASYGHLGRIEDAQNMWADALRVNPLYSLEHRRQVLPYKDPMDFDRIVDGLKMAGLPE